MHIKQAVYCTAAVLLLLAVADVSAADLDALKSESYAAEIELSSKQELQQWASRLGIDAQDLTEDQLRSALYDHYDLERSESERILTDSDEEVLVELESAHRTEFSDRLVFHGSVTLEIKQSYSISADMVIILPEQQRIAAVGNVEAVLFGEQEETYHADSFILSYDGNSGVFIGARLQSTLENSSGESTDYYLTGATMITDSDTALLTDSFMTSNIDHAYYSLQADEMRLLSSGDWFIRNALLRIGRVPVLYLPFFFYPSQTLFFHPAFGFDSQRGAFINTTTYLFGEPEGSNEQNNSTFSSYLKLREGSSGAYTTRDGAVLIPTDTPPTSNLQQWALQTNSFLALQTDMYEREGAYLSVDSKLYDGMLSFTGGLGSDGSRARYMVEPSLDVTGDVGSLSLSFPWYSDPEIKTLLTDRKGDFALNTLSPGYHFDRTYNWLDTFSWEIDADATIRPEALSPAVDYMSLSELNSSVSWEYDGQEYRPGTITYLTSKFEMAGTIFEHKVPPKEQQAEGDQTPDTPSFDLKPIELLNLPGDKRPVDSSNTFDLLPSEPLDTNRPSRRTERPKSPLQTSLSYKIDQHFSSREFAYSSAQSYTQLRETLVPQFTFKAAVYGDNLTITDRLKPVFSYAHMSRDTAAETEYTLLNDLSVTSRLANVSYRYRKYLYHPDITQPVISHSLGAEVPVYGGQVTYAAGFSSVLPPLTLQVEPYLRAEYQRMTAKASVPFIRESSNGTDSWKMDPAEVLFRYAWSKDTYLQTTGSIDSQDLSESQVDISGKYTPLDKLSMTGTASSFFQPARVESANVSIDAFKSSLQLFFEQDENPPFSSLPAFSHLIFHTGNISVEQTLWKDRITLSAATDASLRVNALDKYDNHIKAGFELKASIAEFLDIRIRTVSRNTKLYRYFPEWEPSPSQPGFFADVLKSFNFFSTQDRKESNFNLDSIQIGIVHYMEDWDLHVDYDASIEQTSETTWSWQPRLSLYVQWKAIPELDFRATAEDDGLQRTIRLQ
ncbi:MAG: hypothetical protein ACQEQU_02660 [Spirochaetota bacterium]